jgi:hypothetical protein
MGATADAGRPVHVATEADVTRVLLGAEAGGAFLELSPGVARILAWGVEEPGSPGRDPLLVALHDAVRASGLLPLHCAAAVRPGEEGATAFLGRSGVGKSTTLVALTQVGWAPVCEDLAWLDPNSLTLFGWDHDVRLLPDAIERLGPVSGRPAGVADDPKHVVSYQELAARFGVERRTVAPLRRLVRLERVDGPTRWGTLSRAEAVPPLWESIGLPLAPSTRRQVAWQVPRLIDAVELATLGLGATSIPNVGD